MANLPANPGEALWIGYAGGKNHYNVGIGQGTSGGNNHEDFAQSLIEGGYTDPDKFFLNAEGNCVFRINAGAGRTSNNTAHPRSELRELLAGGESKGHWDGRSGEHSMKARSRIIDVTTTHRPWVCFGQIHGSQDSPESSDLVRLQIEGPNGATTNLNIVCRRSPPSGGSEIVTVLRGGYNVNDWISWEIRMDSGRLRIILDGVTKLDVTGMGQIGNYFKMGCYLQDNVEKGADANDFAAVEVERGTFVTWHSGTPNPTTPIFTGGTDPGGGTGDTQAPTVPGNFAVLRGDQQVTLTWDASVDNVGVDHYNVYRGSGGASITVGKSSDGAGSSASSATKIAVSRVSPSATGTVTAGHARAWLSVAGTTKTKVVIYADSAGEPGNLLAVSDETTITQTTEGVRDYVFSGVNRVQLTQGANYWLGLMWGDPGTPALQLSRDDAANGRREFTGFTYPTPPDPAGTPSGSFAGPIDVWVETGGMALIAQPTGTSYVDVGVGTPSQTLGVGGIAAPNPGPGVVLVGSNSGSTLNVASDTVYDGGGHSVPRIVANGVDNVVIQNFVIHGGNREGVLIRGTNVTVQNCDIYGISDSAAEDINAITFFGDGTRILYNTIGVTDFLARGTIGGSHTDAFQTWNNDPGEQSSNVAIIGNRIVGPATSDGRFIHQGVQAEGKNATSGGGGGTGVSANWIISDNSFEFDCKNQVIKLDDIDDCVITRNTFAGKSAHVIDNRATSTGTVFYADNVISGTYGNVGISITSGTGPNSPTLPNGTEYSYAVSAVDAAGNESARTDQGTVTPGPPDVTPPTVPTSLSATPGDRRVSLSWTASTDTGTGVRGYRVYRDGVLVGESTGASLVDTELANGTTYTYRVSAVDNSLNESAQSNSALATPAAPPIDGADFLPELPGSALAVEVAFGADLAADPAGWVWTDVTQDVRQDPGISTSLGRNDESSTSNPAQLTLALDNTSGDYSFGGRSQHWPYVRRNTPVRLRIDPGDGGGGRVVFHGGADGWTPGWDSLTGRIPVVALSVSGTLRRLAQGDAPIQSAYRRVMTAASTVQAYWPFEEGKDSTYAPAVKGAADMTLTATSGFNTVDHGAPLSSIVGAPDWEAETSFDCSAPLPVLKTGAFVANVTPYADTGKNQVRFLMAVPENGLADATTILHVHTSGSIRWGITHETLSTGAAGLGLFLQKDGVEIGGTTFGFNLNGTSGRLSLEFEQVGSDIRWKLSHLNVGGKGGSVDGLIQDATTGIVRQIEVNPHGHIGDLGFGHLSVENVINSLFTDQRALFAYRGEYISSGSTNPFISRLERLCDENGVALSRHTSSPATPGPLAPFDSIGPQLVAPLLQLLREAEAADQGQLWDGRAHGLSYTTRRRREEGIIKLVVDAGNGELAEGFEPVDDDQRTRNLVEVKRTNGVTAAWQDVSGPLGTDTIGTYDESVTVNLWRDQDVIQHAQWRVGLGTVEGYRFPSVTVDLRAAPHLAPAVLDIIPGERIDVINLDDTLDAFTAPSVSLIVEGIAHELGARMWRVTFQCSPFEGWGVGKVAAETGDTSDMCMRLDTDGAQLAAARSAGATSLSVSTASRAAPWTTRGDDYPLWVEVGGLPVRITACSGASSPQTMTCDPLPVARSAGDPVRLWQPRRLGMGQTDLE